MAGSTSPHGPDFWKIWGDGMAEMNGYDLTYPEYNSCGKASPSRSSSPRHSRKAPA